MEGFFQHQEDILHINKPPLLEEACATAGEGRASKATWLLPRAKGPQAELHRLNKGPRRDSCRAEHHRQRAVSWESPSTQEHSPAQLHTTELPPFSYLPLKHRSSTVLLMQMGPSHTLRVVRLREHASLRDSLQEHVFQHSTLLRDQTFPRALHWAPKVHLLISLHSKYICELKKKPRIEFQRLKEFKILWWFWKEDQVQKHPVTFNFIANAVTNLVTSTHQYQRPWVRTATSPMQNRLGHCFNIWLLLFFFFFNCLIHHHTWRRRDYIFTISKSAEISGLMLQTALDSITEIRSPDNNCTPQYSYNLSGKGEYFEAIYLLPKAGTVNCHFTTTVNSLHMQETIQWHTLRALPAGHGAISSYLLLPSMAGWQGGLQRGQCLTADHQVAITTQKRTPLPKRTSRECQVVPVQVTTLGGHCPYQILGHGISLLHPHWSLEDRLRDQTKCVRKPGTELSNRKGNMRKVHNMPVGIQLQDGEYLETHKTSRQNDWM